MEADTTSSNSASGNNGNDEDHDKYFVLCEFTGVLVPRKDALSLRQSNLTVSRQRQRESYLGSGSSGQSTGRSTSNSQGSGKNQVIDLVSDDDEEEISSLVGIDDNLSIAQQTSACSSRSSGASLPPRPKLVQHRCFKGPLKLIHQQHPIIGPPKSTQHRPPNGPSRLVQQRPSNDLLKFRCNCGARFKSSTEIVLHKRGNKKPACNKSEDVPMDDIPIAPPLGSSPQNSYVMAPHSLEIEMGHQDEFPITNQISNKYSAKKKLKRGCEYVHGSKFTSKVAKNNHTKFVSSVRKFKRDSNVNNEQHQYPFRQGRFLRKFPQQSHMAPRKSVIMSPPHKVIPPKIKNSNQAELINLVSDDDDNEDSMNETTDNPYEKGNSFGKEIAACLQITHNLGPDYGKSYGCVLCPQAYRDLAQLKIHLSNEHQSKENVSIRVKCGICGEEFGSCKSFHAHRNSSHHHHKMNKNHQNYVPGEMPDQVSPQDSNQNEENDNGRVREEEWQMERTESPRPQTDASSSQQCANVLVNGKRREQAIKRSHAEYGFSESCMWCPCGRKCQREKKFKCHKCQQPFYSFRRFKEHLKKKHGLENPLKDYAVGCSRCGIMFKSRTELEHHTTTKHKRKVYKPRGTPIQSRSPRIKSREMDFGHQETRLNIVRKTNVTITTSVLGYVLISAASANDPAGLPQGHHELL